MRRLFRNRKGVANVYGYVIAIGITFLVMMFAYSQKESIEDAKRNQAADLIAQQLANQIADVFTDAIAVARPAISDPLGSHPGLAGSFKKEVSALKSICYGDEHRGSCLLLKYS